MRRPFDFSRNRLAAPNRSAAPVDAGVVAVLLLVLAARLLRRLVVRVVVVVALAALAIGLWDQRAELGDCVATCDCSLFGQVVEVPFDLNPRCA